MSRPRLTALLLALVTLAVYWPVTRHDFVCYDDNEYVTDNLVVQQGLTLAGVKWAFTTGRANNWHPVTWLSHMADCELFGLTAGAHHFVNALLHSANVALLFLLLLRLTGKIWPSALVAALFGWHPLHVESVAWVAERKDVLSTFFALLSLLAYTRYAQGETGDQRRVTTGASPSRITHHASLYLALLWFALGLMAKPMLVTLPFILLLLDYWPLQRFSLSAGRWALLLEKWPFFLLAAVSCAITLGAQHAVMSSLEAIPLHSRLENAVAAVAEYGLKIFWPTNLAVFYPFTKISFALAVLAAALLLLVSAAAWLARNHSRCWLVGWLWFLGTLVPVIGLVQVGVASMADRYTYVPAIGIFIALVFGLQRLAEQRPRLQKSFAGGALLLLLTLGAVTERQLGWWQDSETLFRHALAVTKNNDIAHANLGLALETQGRFDEALTEYRAAANINPHYYLFRFAAGHMEEKIGKPAGAASEYRECLRFAPQNSTFHNALGDALAAEGNFAESQKECAEALRLDPGYALPHIVMAKIFFKQGQSSQAVAELWNAAKAEPYNSDVLAQVAHSLAANQDAAARDGTSALALAARANQLSNHRHPEVPDILGMACAETGDFTRAVICAQTALEIAADIKWTNTAPMRQRLELYQNRQTWRESFGPTNEPAGK